MSAQLTLEDILIKPMRVCEYCGVDISHKRLTSRYCCGVHYQRMYRATHKEEIKAYRATYQDIRDPQRYRKYRQKVASRVNELLPNVCFFNGCKCRNRKDKVNLILHEKSGNGHAPGTAAIIYKEPNRAPEFVRLCHRHHDMVHALMDMGRTWDEIRGLL